MTMKGRFRVIYVKVPKRTGEVVNTCEKWWEIPIAVPNPISCVSLWFRIDVRTAPLLPWRHDLMASRVIYHARNLRPVNRKQTVTVAITVQLLMCISFLVLCRMYLRSTASQIVSRELLYIYVRSVAAVLEK